jgi:hypothetical protein
MRHRLGEARGVDEDVEPPVRLLDGLAQGEQRCGVGDIGRIGLVAFASQSGEDFLRRIGLVAAGAMGDRDLGASVGEEPRGRGADAARAADDEGRLAGERFRIGHAIGLPSSGLRPSSARGAVAVTVEAASFSAFRGRRTSPPPALPFERLGRFDIGPSDSTHMVRYHDASDTAEEIMSASRRHFFTERSVDRAR